MAYSIVCKDEDDFQKLIESKDKNLSIEIVKIILNNLSTKKRFIPVLEVYLETSDVIVDLTVDRKDFIDTLEKNLKTLLSWEEYEWCSKIKKGIDKLNKKNEKINKQL
jgi:hypothetical protein